jgi:hypothetical protein
MNNKILTVARWLLAITTILIVTGCFKYPPVEKELFSWTLSREQLVEIKNTLEENGYKKITRDNYPYEGAFVTQYSKEINTKPELKDSQVQIYMSFKTENLNSDKYRNYGFSVFNLHHDDVKEINDEIDRIENIIHGKLIDFAGANNVVRGPR